ncbi:hypothetical protein [Streptomyces sp. NPDC048172]|uniref:hypothetical protein n=1 Tax=Streptomyces sp. NPDC048172 TaxID=3365505 RepID=UPI00371A7EC2
MSVFLARARAANGTAARAAGHALAGSALAAGLHDALTDSAISLPALALAAAVLAAIAYAVLRGERPRWSVLALAGTQALLPTRLSLAVAATARRWREHLFVALGLASRALTTPAPPATGSPPPSPTTLPPAHSLTVLLDRVQPCAP